MAITMVSMGTWSVSHVIDAESFSLELCTKPQGINRLVHQ